MLTETHIFADFYSSKTCDPIVAVIRFFWGTLAVQFKNHVFSLCIPHKQRGGNSNDREWE